MHMAVRHLVTPDIEDILIRLIENRLKIKPTKCEWAKHSVTFLGHIISAQGITTEPRNTEKIAKVS